MWSSLDDVSCTLEKNVCSAVVRWSVLKMSLCVCVGEFSRAQLLVTPWTEVHQAPLSMEFPRQEY